MATLLPSSVRPGAKIMVFIDGENLAIRYADMLGDKEPPSHVIFQKDVYVWTLRKAFALVHHNVIRQYYYTSIVGDEKKRREVHEKLKSVGIEAPRVFRKTRGRRSKQVDISLATDMLTHAHRKNYDIAVLIAGDQDYVPLVDAVMAEGSRVVLWFVTNGLSDDLKRKVDYYFDLAEILLEYNDRLLGQKIGMEFGRI